MGPPKSPKTTASQAKSNSSREKTKTSSKCCRKRRTRKKAKRRTAGKSSDQIRASQAFVGREFVLSSKMAQFLGKETRARKDVTKDIWAYVDRHQLKASSKIVCDPALRALFGVSEITFLGLQKFISPHLLCPANEMEKVSPKRPVPLSPGSTSETRPEQPLSLSSTSAACSASHTPAKAAWDNLQKYHGPSGLRRTSVSHPLPEGTPFIKALNIGGPASGSTGFCRGISRPAPRAAAAKSRMRMLMSSNVLKVAGAFPVDNVGPVTPGHALQQKEGPRGTVDPIPSDTQQGFWDPSLFHAVPEDVLFRTSHDRTASGKVPVLPQIKVEPAVPSTPRHCDRLHAKDSVSSSRSPRILHTEQADRPTANCNTLRDNNGSLIFESENHPLSPKELASTRTAHASGSSSAFVPSFKGIGQPSNSTICHFLSIRHESVDVSLTLPPTASDAPSQTQYCLVVDEHVDCSISRTWSWTRVQQFRLRPSFSSVNMVHTVHGLEPRSRYRFCVLSSNPRGGDAGEALKVITEVILIPRTDMQSWSTQDVVAFMRLLHIPNLASACSDCGMLGSELHDLCEEDLRALGLHAPFLIRRVLNSIQDYSQTIGC